jgi:peroxiredoxin
MMALRVGDPAPSFIAHTHDGQDISLEQFRGTQPVVLFFYPKERE